MISTPKYAPFVSVLAPLCAALACGSSGGQAGRSGDTPQPNPACTGAAPCDPGCSACNGSCVDETADPENCGGCGTVCNPGLSCVSSQCVSVCMQGQTMCGDHCADLAADPGNCGACGAACPIGAACISSKCATPVVLASGLDFPGGLAVDATYVYFTQRTDAGATTIDRVPIAGGAVETVGGSLSEPTSIAVQGSNVYWGDYRGMQRIPVTGGMTETLSSSGSGVFAMDATDVYWPGDDHYIDAVPLAGSGAVMALAPYDVLGGIAIAVEGAQVYWANYGSVFSAPVTGGSSRQVTTYMVTSEANISPMVVDGQNAYFFLSYQDEALYVVAPLAGGNVQMTRISSSCSGDCVFDVKADDGSVYFIQPGTIEKISKSKGVVAGIADNQANPTALAVDDANVYWLNSGGMMSKDGSIVKMPK